MTGERALSKIQWGLEATRGLAVAADTILLAGEHPPILPDRVPTFIEDDAGVRAQSVRTPRIDQFLVQDSLNFDNGYFQLLPLLFSMGIKGNITPVEQSSGASDFKWTFTPSMTASNTIDTGTLEVGDDTQAYEAAYMMISRIRLAGDINQEQGSSVLNIEVDYFARQWSPTTFTAALSIPTNESINAKLTRFFQDSTFANLGTTEKTGLLRSYDIEILTGNHPKFQGGINKFFDVHGEGKFEVMSNLVLEGNSDADAIYDEYQVGTQTFLEFNVSGNQIGTGVNQNLTLGVGGYWENVTPLSENSNGNNLHAALHHGTFDPTASQIFSLSTITDVSAI